MKVWNSITSEHSAKLRIVGSFKTVEKAREAAIAFNEFLDLDESDIKPEPGLYFSDKVGEVMKKTDVHLTEHDPESFCYFYPIEADGNQIIIETDELEIQGIMKVLIAKGAKIELYSKHDYPQG